MKFSLFSSPTFSGLAFLLVLGFSAFSWVMLVAYGFFFCPMGSPLFFSHLHIYSAVFLIYVLCFGWLVGNLWGASISGGSRDQGI